MTPAEHLAEAESLLQSCKRNGKVDYDVKYQLTLAHAMAHLACGEIALRLEERAMPSELCNEHVWLQKGTSWVAPCNLPKGHIGAHSRLSLATPS